MGGQAHAQLALAVVHQPLAGAATVQMGHVPARDGSNVVGAAVFTGWPRQVVLAVVQLADDDGAVDVGIDKVHRHFGAGSRTSGHAKLTHSAFLKSARYEPSNTVITWLAASNSRTSRSFPGLKTRPAEETCSRVITVQRCLSQRQAP